MLDSIEQFSILSVFYTLLAIGQDVDIIVDGAAGISHGATGAWRVKIGQEIVVAMGVVWLPQCFVVRFLRT